MASQNRRGRLEWEIGARPFYTSCDLSLLCSRWPISQLGTITHVEVAYSLESLTYNQIQVLIRRYGLDGQNKCTLQTIAAEAKRTSERIWQVEVSAIRRLFLAITAQRQVE